ncbi:MAG TPA: tetratricopeptide repeat protein [Candidatus Acidoferrum sp.]|nr:tetratricopeptide repeat protein [Candidatus Acidoferrum sp.]
MKPLNVITILLFEIISCLAGDAGAQAPLDEARKLFDQGHYQEAEKLFRQEATQTPPRADVFYWIGRCGYELHDNDKAVNNAERAVELDPKVAAYHNFLAVADGHKAEHSSWFSGLSLARKASHEFQEAVRLDSHNVQFQRDLISYYVRAPGIAGGGDEKAEAQIAQLAKIDPVQGRLAKLELYEEKRKWGLAEEECKAILAAKTKDIDPYLEIAEHYESHEDATGIREALSAVPQNLLADPRVNFYRSVADILAGDHFQEAETSLKSFEANLPQRRDDRASLSASHRWLGQLYEKLGNRSSAAAEYRKAIELDPNDKPAHDGLKRTSA